MGKDKIKVMVGKAKGGKNSKAEKIREQIKKLPNVL